MSSARQWKSRSVFVVVTLIVAALMFAPGGQWVMYPFRLFATFIHEAGHALTAAATGATVGEFEVNVDGSGHITRRGGWTLLVAPAGYLATVFAGAAMLFAGRCRKWWRPALLTLGGVTLAITAAFAGADGSTGLGMTASLLAFALFAAGAGVVVFGKTRAEKAGDSQLKYLAAGGALAGAAVIYVLISGGGLLAWVIGMIMGSALVAIALYAGRLIQQLTVLFLGVQLSLDGLRSIQVLFELNAHHGHEHNDAATMAEATGLPAEFWAISWGLMSLVVIAAALWRYWRG